MSINAPKKSNSSSSSSSQPQRSQKQSQDSQRRQDANAFTESRAQKKSQAESGYPCHTKVVVKFNCGFQNNLYIRGEGVKGLSWEKGSPMKCTKADEWVWETDVPFGKEAKFKVLINDRQFEVGENHPINCGKAFTIAPKF